MNNYDSFNRTTVDAMRICPVSFKSFSNQDFNWEAVSNLEFLPLADYVINYFDNWVDENDKRYFYLAQSRMLISFNPQDRDMVQWEQFFEYVLPSVQGCPVAMVESALRSAAIEFCEKTLLWKQDSITNDVVEGEAFYTYAPPPSAKVVGPYKVCINGKELEPWDLARLEAFDKNWKQIKEDYPSRYVQVMDDTIRLVGVPNKEILADETDPKNIQGLTADVALKPTRNTRTCPTFLFTDWAETIAAGALANLHARKGKIWANTDLVARFDSIFKAGISRAKSKSDKSWQRETVNMLPVKFYGKRGYFN